MALKKDDMNNRARSQTQAAGLNIKNTGKLEPLIIRLSQIDRQRLEVYCQTRGLKLSQGARMIIKKCLEEEGI